MLRGMASAQWIEAAGQPLPFLAVPEERPQRGDLPGLAGRFQWLAETVAQTDRALDVVADLHPVQRGDPRSAGLTRPVGRIRSVGLFGGDPPADLEQVRSDAAANARGQRRGRVPAVGPLFPDRRATGCPRRVAAGAGTRRITESELGDRPLHRVQGVQPTALQQLVAADPVEQRRVQILKMRAAVEQEQMAGHHRQQRVLVPAEPVSPSAEDRAQSCDLAVDAVASEDPPGQGEPLEAAESVELVEGSEQVGVRCEIGADLVACPGGRVLAELGLSAAEQVGPFLLAPAPEGPAGRRAPRQQHRDHIEHGPSAVRGRRGVQCGVDRLQRAQQPRYHAPAWCGRVGRGTAVVADCARPGRPRPWPRQVASPPQRRRGAGRSARTSVRPRPRRRWPAVVRSPRHLRRRAVRRREHLYSPGMDVLHAAGQLVGQVPAGQVDVLER